MPQSTDLKARSRCSRSGSLRLLTEMATLIVSSMGCQRRCKQLSAWLTESDTQIESAFKSFLSVAGQIASAGAAVFGKLFAYLREHGPQIRAFFADFWKELQGVWTTIKPVVMGVLAGLREMFEVVSRLTGGNTKLLAWLASAYVGWKAPGNTDSGRECGVQFCAWNGA